MFEIFSSTSETYGNTPKNPKGFRRLRLAEFEKYIKSHVILKKCSWFNVHKAMLNQVPMIGNGFYIPPIKMVTGGWFMALF